MTPPRALILTMGTRGDVEPFIALSLGLRAAGIEPVLCTSERYSGWIGEFGVRAAPVTDALLAQMDTPEGKAMIEGAGGWAKRLRAGVRLARVAGPLNAQIMEESWAAAREAAPDVILFHPKMLAAPHIAERLGVPAIMAAFQPMYVATRGFPVPGLPFPDVAAINRLSYRALEAGYGAYRKQVNALRRDALHLPSVRRGAEVLAPDGAGPIPVLHAISPHVVPRPADWPARAQMTGYWRLKPREDFTPPAELEAFLSAGPAPVYIGFGSMPSADGAALGRLAAEALRLAGVRGVVSAGWAGMAVEARDDLIVAPPVPHDWLFPRMAAVVHHGGAGTTAAGFFAGIPCVVCPFGGDQGFWAGRSVALGVGAPPVPRRRLTAERLAASIRAAVNDPALRANAAALARELAAEDGVARGVAAISDRMAVKV